MSAQDLVIKLRLDGAGQVAQGLTEVNQAVQKNTQTIAQGHGQAGILTTGLTNGFKLFGAAAVAAFGVQAVVSFTKELVLAGAAAQRLTTSLNFATGGNASQYLAQLGAFAKASGLNFADTARAFSGFVAAANGAGLSGEKALKTFEQIALAGKVMGASKDEMSGIMLAVQQMMSKGTVSAEEFRGQLAERMPTAFAAGAAAVGKTTQEFAKMLDSGELLAYDFLPKFAEALSRSISDKDIASAVTGIDAQLARLGNSYEKLKSSMGNAGAGQAVSWLSGKLANDLTAIGEAFDLVGKRGGGAFAAWNEGLGIFLGRALGLDSVLDSFKTLSQQQASANATIAALNARESAGNKLSMFELSQRAQAHKAYQAAVSNQATLAGHPGRTAHAPTVAEMAKEAEVKAEAAYAQLKKDRGYHLAVLEGKLSDYKNHNKALLSETSFAENQGVLSKQQVISKKAELEQAYLQQEAQIIAQRLAQYPKVNGKVKDEDRDEIEKLNAQLRGVKAALKLSKQDEKQDISTQAKKEATQQGQDALDLYLANSAAQQAMAINRIKQLAQTDSIGQIQALQQQAATDDAALTAKSGYYTQLLTLYQTDADKYRQISLDKAKSDLDADKQRAAAQQAMAAKVFELTGNPSQALGNSLKDMAADLTAIGDKAAGLGKVVSGFGAMQAAAKTYAATMREVNALRQTDPGAAQKLEAKAIKENARSQIGAYADIAGGAKDMFAQNTQGYAAMAQAEKNMRMIQFALSAQAVIQNGIEAMSSATVAVANQGRGDPYTAFARIAAMVALMAGLGIAIVGGNASTDTQVHKDDFAAKEATTGAGTALGDATALSGSIAKSLQTLTDLARPELAFSSQMAASLRIIESQFAAAAKSVVSGNGLQLDTSKIKFGGDVALPPEGNFFTNFLDAFSGFLGGSTNVTQSIVDQGLGFNNQSVNDAIAGLKGYSYAVQKTLIEKSTWYGSHSSSESYQTGYGALSSDLKQSFSRVFTELKSNIVSAAGIVGVGSAKAESASGGVAVDLSKISTYGKTGAQVAEIFQNAIGSTADKMALAAAPIIGGFMQMGEGAYQTLVRVSTAVEAATVALEPLGVSLIGLANVANKTGNASTELVRDSLLAAESGYKLGNGISAIVQGFSGDAKALVDAYAALVAIRRNLTSIGINGQAVSSYLIAGAGGLDQLQSSIANFSKNFLSDEEQLTQARVKASSGFAALGMALPLSAAAFKKAVLDVDTSSAAGQKRLGQLLALSDSYQGFLDAQQKITDAAKQAAEALNTAANSVRQWLLGVDSGSLGLATGAQKISDTRSAYVQGLALANTNDEAALKDITAKAAAYLQAARDNSTSQIVYAAILAQVKQELANLPAVQVASIAAMRAGNSTGNKPATVPAFAAGGLHSGGLRLVGEAGPELEITGPARIVNAADTARLLHAINQSTTVPATQPYLDSAALLIELQNLRNEVAQLRTDTRAGHVAIAGNTRAAAQTLDKWDVLGLPQTSATV